MSLRRVIGAGWKNFIRGGSVSIATVVVMTVTLSIIGGLILISALLSYTLESIRDKVGISVYFVTTATEPEILAFKEKIEALPQVEQVSYTNREEALAEFKEMHATNQIYLKGLGYLDENPFSAHLTVKAHDPSQYEAIATTLETTPALSAGGGSIVSRVNYDDEMVKDAINRLSRGINTTRDVGLAVVILFGIASFMIAFATIRLAIYTARDEIAVMRLVGASNSYIRGPFMVAGIIAGIIATLVVLLGLFPIAWYGGQKTASWLDGFHLFEYYTDNFLMIAATLLISGVVLGGAASLVAVRRYLKV